MDVSAITDSQPALSTLVDRFGVVHLEYRCQLFEGDRRERHRLIGWLSTTGRATGEGFTLRKTIDALDKDLTRLRRDCRCDVLVTSADGVKCGICGQRLGATTKVRDAVGGRR